MGRLIILVIIIAGLLWFLHWFRTTPAPRVASVLRKTALWGGIGLLVLATVSGRLNPIFAAIAGALAVMVRLASVLQMLPMLRQLLQSLGLGGLAAGLPGSGGAASAGTSGGSGQVSSIRTRYLDVTLAHATGEMDGSIREGPFQGQRLSDLLLPQLLRMLELYQDSDDQSAAVLTAYLDREHGEDWRDATAYGPAGDRAGAAGSNLGQGASALTRDEALSILGLAPDADADAVRSAHRRLMQKLHPDRGGSDYLAAQINAAKRVLLGD